MHFIIYNNADKTIPNRKTAYARQIKKNNYLFYDFASKWRILSKAVCINNGCKTLSPFQSAMLQIRTQKIHSGHTK